MRHARQARRGGQLMDRVRPGWNRRVRRSQLKLSSQMECVLGQEYGFYWLGLEELGLGRFGSWWHGFSTPGNYETLTEAWLAEIDQRNATGQDTETGRVLTLV